MSATLLSSHRLPGLGIDAEQTRTEKQLLYETLIAEEELELKHGARKLVEGLSDD